MNVELNDILFEGENSLWSGKPDKFCYIWRSVGKLLPFALIWLLFDGFMIGSFVSAGELGAMWWFVVIFFALHLMPVWICVGQLVKLQFEHKNVIYAITDKRVLLRNGVIGLDFENINYTDISNIRLDVSVIERIRNVGSIFITTSSGKAICFASVSNPYEVYKQLNKVFMDMKSDIEYPNALRPDCNPGYKTNYKY